MNTSPHATAETAAPRVRLLDGSLIPQVGFGVYQLEGAACQAAVEAAIAAGYRHFDTAQHYFNEEHVAAAIRASGIPREQCFITTKTPWVLTRASLRACLDESLRKMRMDYVDLYLIHWPTGDVTEAWSAMQELRSEGRMRALGVSNFTIRRFEEVHFPHSSEAPVVNQIEYHVYNRQPELVDYCRSKGIAIMAYSPLARSMRAPAPALAAIAAEIGRSPQQVMLRWSIQTGAIILPKSAHPERMRDNLALFDFALSDKQMHQLNTLHDGSWALSWRPATFF